MYREILGLAAALCLVATCKAEVLKVGPGGFTVRSEVVVRSDAQHAWHALVNDIGKWWNAQHSYSGNAENLSIDARPGGCFCERLPNGGGVVHMTVVNVQPGKLLRLTGGLGPLQALGVAGSLSWSFTPVAGGTKIEVSYSVGGFNPDGFEHIAPAVDEVLRGQLQSLAAFTDGRQQSTSPVSTP
jgi:uncharacterized protein YndB with AHSA1/START domain